MSRVRSASSDGGAMKIRTASGIVSAIWRAPWTSISSTTGAPVARALVELGAQRPVPAAGVARVLDERRRPATRRSNSVVGEEVVVDAVLLPRPRRRVVADTASSSSGIRSSSVRMSVPLPTPEGPVITNTRPIGRAS